MGDLILPNPRFEKPSLFYPKRKPVGNVKIDWSHPLTRGLSFCVLDEQDLVSGVWPLRGTGYEYSIEGGGKCSDFTKSANSYLDYPKAIFDSYGDGLSVFSVQKTLSAIGVHYLIDTTSGNTEHFRVFVENGSSPRFRLFADSAKNLNAVTAGRIMGREEVSLACTYDKAEMKISVDGALSDAVAQTGDITPQIDNLRLGSALIPSDRGNYFLYIILIYKRALSAIEIKSLHANPYQFLIPA
jgi:hypothetical protein